MSVSSEPKRTSATAPWRKPDGHDVYDVARAEGYYSSRLNPAVYEQYARDPFVETLDEWGWYGDASAVPSWFSGHKYRRG